MAPRASPLWLRALKDPAAKAWIRRNRNEFPTESFLPDPVAYKDKIVLAREKVAALIADGMPYDDPKTQRLAELVLEVTPREAARELRIPRPEVYLRIRALKRLAINKWEAKREAEVLARNGPKRRAAPEGVALQTVRFTHAGEERYAYQVQIGRERTWLDSEGFRFTADVQELLNNLEAYQVEFELLEVYNGKA